MADLVLPSAAAAYERQIIRTGGEAVKGVGATLVRATASRDGGDGRREVGGGAMLVSISGRSRF
jgi:hypothetical protein